MGERKGELEQGAKFILIQTGLFEKADQRSSLQILRVHGNDDFTAIGMSEVEVRTPLMGFLESGALQGGDKLAGPNRGQSRHVVAGA